MNDEATCNEGPPPNPASARLKAALLWSAVVIAVLALLAARLDDPIIEHRPDFAMTMYFALKQDIPVAGLAIALLAGLWFLVGRAPATAQPALRLKGWQAWAVLVLPALAAYVLRAHILPDYDLSRDEQMVTFDAAIFSKGHLFEPIPSFWRNYYDALNKAFLLPIGDREAWVSGYLPGNAALHALIGMVLPASAASPLLLLVAALALWRITLRLWPDSASTRAAVLLLFTTSSQVIVMATATYAMTAHLALNLVWLALFLRRTPLAQAGAILTGFVATGLHQPLFHPMFVAPFLLMLLRNRAWKELSVYVVCYGAIGLFWIGWQPWISAHGVLPVPTDHSGDGVDYLERFRRTATPLTRFSFFVMAGNLLRLAAWNHLLLLPLAAIGIAVRRSDRFVQALWLGMALLVVFMTLVLPAQVNGWGYRYLHGFLGSAVLLAGYGWHWLEREGAAPVRAFVATAALGILVILPLHVWMAKGQLGGYAEAARAAGRFDADMVVIDEGIPFAGDLVLNRPDLSNRPIRLARNYVKPGDFPALCAHGTIAFADAPQFGAVSRFFRIPPPAAPTPRQVRLRTAAEAAGCRIVPSAPQ
ncbi:hypothetical protein H7F51_16110 [Novosphingobium flavum]|uniref:4-amino-4-deoxy-L-arabinose transferase n=1 Tax=Novosphingobium flavum TaxID=1778672 RepID=A0A7X1FU64_9SPHN|nr:hypothetical protein [Novosphingobium flavum]MBC2667043.1 hypothetical protein [Novosphingobium flavum]